MECDNKSAQNDDRIKTDTDLDVPSSDTDQEDTVNEPRLEQSSEQTEGMDVPPSNTDQEGTVNEPQLEKSSEQTEDTEALIESLIESHFNVSADSDKSITHSHNTSEDDLLITTDDIDENSDTLDNQSAAPKKATVSVAKPEKLCHLPLGSVKRIIKSDPDVTLVSAESIFLISKATELFLQWLGKEVHSYTVRQKKKTIHIRDLNSAISEIPALQFLDGALD